MTMLTWPADLPPPFEGGYAPFSRSLSGGQSLSGFEQVQPQLHDRWGASFSFHLGTDDRILAMRALLTSLRGRANTVLLPAFDRNRAPYVVTAGVIGGVAIGEAFTDPPFWRRYPGLAGTPFEFEALATAGVATVLADDRVSFVGDEPSAGQWVTLLGARREILAISGSGPWELTIRPRLVLAPGSAASSVGSTVTAAVEGSAAPNATQVDVRITVGAAPRPGHLFSLGSRLHSIDLGGVHDFGGGLYRLTIWPWLRAAVTSGTAANFTSPACEMRLATDQEADGLRALRLGRYGDITLRFDEASAA